MNTINELQDEVIEEFNEFTDWMDKYQMLIDLGNDLEPLDEKHKNEQNLIEGCQSRGRSSMPTSISSRRSVCASTSRRRAPTVFSRW